MSYTKYFKSGQKILLTAVPTETSSGHTGFRIERSLSGTRRFELVANLAAGATTFTDTGLNPGTTYHYRIRPLNAGGIGPASNPASASTEAQPPPAAPTGLIATSIGHARIDLAWTDNSTDEQAYELQRSTTGQDADFVTVAALPANTTAASDTSGLAPETTYFYRVRATKDFSASAWSSLASASTAPLPPPPAAPSGLAVLWLSHDTVRIGWTDASFDETGFEVQRSPSGAEGTYVTVATTPADATSFTQSGLQTRAQYFYRIRSTNGATHSAWSAPVNFATKQFQTVLGSPVTGWFRGRTGSTPSSALTVQNGSELLHFTGGAAGSDAHYAQVWRYLTPPGPPLALADGETLRLTANFSHQGTLPNTARALRFGFYNSNGTRIEADIGGDNNAAHVDDAGYGFAIATGTNTTTRHVADVADASSPLRDLTTDIGAATGLYAVSNGTPRELRYELTRSGQGLLLRAYLDGVLFDSGREVATASTLSFDMLMLCNRNSGVTWTIHSLLVERSVPTDIAPVNAPSAFGATGVAYNRIALSWADNSANETGFALERSPSGLADTYTPLATLPADATAYADEDGLTFSTTYHYRLRALGEFENSSAWITVSGATQALPEPPAAPSGLGVNAVNSSGLALAWTDNSNNETGFEIQRSATGGLGTFANIGTAPADATAYTDTGLALATRYFYRVRSTNGVTHSEWTPIAHAATTGVSTVVQNPTGGWYRGMIASTPASSLSVQNTTQLAHFTGGSGWTHDYYAQFWRYFAPVTIADGQTLRLSVTFAYTNDGTRPNIDRALRFGLLNSNGTQAIADINSNNSPSQTEDYGYGIALGSGTNTTSRYIEERPAETAFAPLITEMRDLGANTGTWSVNDSADHTLVLDLRRQGTELHILATLDGAPFDGGRVVTAPHTFTYDMLMLGNRTRGVTWIVRSLAVEALTPVGALAPLAEWRLQNFDTTISESYAADLADPDGDGIPNLLEYALGSDPLSSGSASLPSPQVSGLSPQPSYLQLTFTPAATEGLRYHVEASSDLVTWTGTEITSLVVAGQPFIHTDGAELGGVARRFLRLRVSQP